MVSRTFFILKKLRDKLKIYTGKWVGKQQNIAEIRYNYISVKTNAGQIRHMVGMVLT